ncbi:uncharacterized protein LOC142532291 [Primulina tabacum]|uniref:uncharacterized protein LOC142532291 n=1 Tax=Primulina tabacum TaxID=48773 RepID=UPI003F5A0BFD
MGNSARSNTMPPKRKVQEGESSKGKAPAVEGEGSAPRPIDDFAQLLQQQAKVHGEQIQQLLEMQRTTHEQAQAQAIVHRHGPVQTDVYDRFRRLIPPEFMGSTDPAVAEEWIKSLESIFSYLHMEDADKATCAIFLLTKHARIWWESARVALPVGPLTWGTFKTVFYNKYFSKDVRAKKASDFLNLKQGTMSMTEYIQQFEAGVQYVPYIAQDDTSKGEHFMRGLRSEIKRDVRMSKVATYGEIVERALMAEQDEQDIDRDRQQRKQQYFQKSQGTGQGKKTDNRGTRPEESRGKGPPPRKEQDTPPCPKCSKLHGGKCMQGSNVCYRCKKPGHLAKNCPGSSEKVQGRLFSMTKEEVDANTSMITVTEVRSFLGLAGYYRRFIAGFSKIALPLTALTRKNVRFVWNEECDRSFQELKAKLTSTPVLAIPEGSGDFVVYSDASKQGLGAVLMQHGKVKPMLLQMR